MFNLNKDQAFSDNCKETNKSVIQIFDTRVKFRVEVKKTQFRRKVQCVAEENT